MAQKQAKGSMKGFYLTIGAIAVAGVAIIGWQVAGGGGAAVRPSLTTALPLVSAGPRGVVMGPDTAPVEITEFADFECPACARYAILTLTDIKTRLIPEGRVRLRFVHFPLNIHPNAPTAHLAAACANEQGRFWDMHDLIYDSQSEWARSNRPDRVMRELAQRARLDMDRYGSCMSEQRAWPQVLADKALGDSIGIDGTPTFALNGRVIQTPTSLTEWRRLVDSVVAASASAAAPAAPARRR